MKGITGPTIGKALRNLLREKEMTQAELSRTISMKESYMSALVNGKIKNTSLATLNRIACGLGITISQVIYEVERVSRGDGK